MKWVKVAISFLVAVMVIPTIILAVKDSTDLKETRTVNFTLLEKNGNTFDITSGTFNELLNNKFIINYDIKSSYPLVTQEDLEIANYKIDDDLKNSFIDRETNPKIIENVGQIVFDGTEEWHLGTGGWDQSGDTLGFYHSSVPDNLKLTGDFWNSLTNTIFSSGLGVRNSDEEGFNYRTDSPMRVLRINKNRLEGYSEGLTNAEKSYLLQAYLSQNPLIVTYELETPITRPAELYDLKTFKLYYDTSSIKVKFDVNDNDYLWEIYYTDHLQALRGEHEVGNTWTVNFYVYDIQQSYVRSLILLIPLIYISGLLLYLSNTFKRE